MRLTDPFDALAASYDDHFSKSRIGHLMRSRVWRRLDSCFSSGQRVLDLGCGTGEDAVHLGRRDIEVLATDRSAEMVGLTREKVARVGLESHVRVERLALESLHKLATPMFDGALSNFGGLNCVADLPAVSEALAARLHPGATAMLCLMGPVVPWEWVWFLAHGEPGKAFRRLKRGGADWRGTQDPLSVGRRCLSGLFTVFRAVSGGRDRGAPTPALHRAVVDQAPWFAGGLEPLGAEARGVCASALAVGPLFAGAEAGLMADRPERSSPVLPHLPTGWLGYSGRRAE